MLVERTRGEAPRDGVRLRRLVISARAMSNEDRGYEGDRGCGGSPEIGGRIAIGFGVVVAGGVGMAEVGAERSDSAMACSVEVD